MAVLEKSTRINVLSQASLLGVFTLFLVTFIIPDIESNSQGIERNGNDIQEIKMVIAEIDIEDIDKHLEKINLKLDKIVLGMCGEFGGKYCE